MAATLKKLQQIAVAAQPTAGKGFALPLDGAVPLMLLQSLGGRKVAVGSSTVNFAASTQSGSKTVSHGLGVTPVFAAAILNGVYGAASLNGVTSSSLVVLGYSDQGALTADVAFYWIAIG